MTFINSVKEKALNSHKPMLGERYDTAYVLIPLANDNCLERFNKLKREFETKEVHRMLSSKEGVIENAFLIPLDVTDIVTLMVFAWDNHQEEIIVISETSAFLKFKRQAKVLNVFTDKYRPLGELTSVGKKPLGDTWIKDQHTGNYFEFNKG